MLNAKEMSPFKHFGKYNLDVNCFYFSQPYMPTCSFIHVPGCKRKGDCGFKINLALSGAATKTMSG
jgi:hypothetical protein